MGSFGQSFREAGRSIRSRLLAGLVVLVPLLLCIWVVRFLFNSLDGWLRPIEITLLGRHVRGTGVLATFILVYLIGVVATNIAGRTILRWTEWLIMKLPLIGDVYGSSKKIMEAVSSPGGRGFRRVVSFDFPRPGVRAIGFVTQETQSKEGEPLCCIFMPHTPNPTTGYMLFLPKAMTAETDLTVEDALKMIVSGGVVAPRDFRPTLAPLPQEANGSRPAMPPAL